MFASESFNFFERDGSNATTHVCQLNTGELFYYDEATAIGVPPTRPMEYIGDGVVYSVNGVVQTNPCLQSSFYVFKNRTFRVAADDHN